MPADERANLIRFGDYSVDLDTGELRKFDRKLALPDQAVQLLAMLLERPGEVVTREQAIARLWPDGTVVDYEHGINSSIRRLRAALNESAERPRFIETLPKRGYRFIGAIESRGGALAAASGPEVHPIRAAPAPIQAKRTWIRAGTGACVALVLLGIAVFQLRTRSDDPISSIAVLPFVNTNSDPGVDYLSDGISEQIINRLSGVPGIRVIARTSAFQFKGKDVDAREAGRKLGVRAVVTGRIAVQGDAVAIQTDLVDVSDSSQIWGDKYNRHIADIQTLEADIAGEIASRLRLRLAANEESRLSRRYTRSSEAYSLYLKAAYTPLSNWPQKMEYLNGAVERDPAFALAYAQLAHVQRTRVMVGELAAVEGLSKAKSLALKALTLDNRIGLAHSVVAEVLQTLDWDWLGAEREFKLAIEDSPASGHAEYAGYLLGFHRPQEAWIEMQRALQSDPLSPDVRALLVGFYGGTGQYEQAIEASQAPGLPGYVSHWRAFALTELGRYAEAIGLLKSDPEGTGDLGHLGYAYARAGHITEAEAIRRQLQHRADAERVGAYSVAMISIALGRKDEAFKWLNVACEHRDPGLKYLTTDATLNSLRSDPRFTTLLRRVRLAP
jgi:TolB-like protein/DNA-binding winged helix-turn-helix (wHTH) protein